MRGAFAAGVLVALERAGFAPTAAYGTSAGGAMIAWFAAGQAVLGAKTFEYANDRTVLSYRRWLLGRGPLIDQERVFTHVYRDVLALDVERVRKAPYPVLVTVCDSQSAQTRYLDLRAMDVLAGVRATGALPGAVAGPVTIDGRGYLDGGITAPIPIARAIEDGHRDILCVLNRPAGPRKIDPKPFRAWLAMQYPALRAPIMARNDIHHDAVALAERPPPGVRVDVVRPAASLGVGRLTRDVAKLRAATAAGVRAGEAWLMRRRIEA